MGCGARSCQTDGVKGFPALRGSLLRGQSSCCARPIYLYTTNKRVARDAFVVGPCSLSWCLFSPSPPLRHYLLSVQRLEISGERKHRCRAMCAAREVTRSPPPQKKRHSSGSPPESRSWKVDDSQSREKNLGQEPFVAPFRRRDGDDVQHIDPSAPISLVFYRNGGQLGILRHTKKR